MRVDDLPAPPRDTVPLYVTVRREARSLLHFHLEASDGMAYVEMDGPDPRHARVSVVPDQVGMIRVWLESWADELGLVWRDGPANQAAASDA